MYMYICTRDYGYIRNCYVASREKDCKIGTQER